jgi:PAS domain S-box-containing protein
MGVIAIDLDFTIQAVDEYCTTLFGLEIADFLGKSIIDFLPDFEITSQHNTDSLKRSHTIQLSLESTAGQIFGIEYQTHKVTSLNLSSYVIQLDKLDTVYSDIEKQTVINETHNQQWLAYLLRASPVVIYSCIPSDNYPTTFISENIFKLTGYTSSEYLSTPKFWLDHLHPDDRDDLLTKMAKLYKTEKSLSFEYRFLCANGEYIWVLDKLKISRNSEGQPTEMLGLWLDITDRIKSEQALQTAHDELHIKSEELTESNVELSQFTYVVSHDLKAPLRAVHSYCDWLSEDLDGKLDEEQQEYITGMQDAVQQAEELIEDLLELSRVGRRAAEIENIHLSEFFKNLTANLVSDESVNVSITSPLPTLQVSPTVLNQVFQNIITNAYKYNVSDDKKIMIDGYDDGDNYVISVSDNGIGIDPRFHERVFQLFQRLHTKEEYDGTGIGLAIVQKAVEHLGWHIALSSTLNEGSTFYITFPKSEIKLHD